MHTNAIESWLARMHRHASQTQRCLNWHFYVQLSEPGQLEIDYPEYKSRIIRSPWPLAKSYHFFREFEQVCRNERFDVVHVHGDLMSAPYLVAARFAGVKHLVVHVHNTDESIPTASRLKQRLYREPMRQVCIRLADHIVGISNHTLDTFLAGRARRPERDTVLYYGVDPSPFEHVSDNCTGFRQRLGLAEDSLILLFGGRLVPEKNPVFVVDVLAKLRDIEPRVVAVFAGAGSLEQRVLERARELRVENAVRLLGWRNDLPEVMNCSDWFILPHPEHPMEGFGLAVVEAQLAGLRLLLSRGISDDPLLPTACFRRLHLADGPMVWAKAAVELLNKPAPSRAAAIASLRESPMNMDRALEGLLELHK